MKDKNSNMFPQSFEFLLLFSASEALFPMFISTLRELRKRNGALNANDKVIENLEVSKALDFLKKHNYFLYLLCIGDFNELYRIYDLFLTPHQRAWVREVEKNHNNQDAEWLNTIKKQSITSQDSVQEKSRFSYADELYALSVMSSYFYYEQKLHFLTITHYKRQTDLYYTAAQSGVADVNRALNIVTARINTSTSESLDPRIVECKNSLLALKGSLANKEAAVASTKAVIDGTTTPTAEMLKLHMEATKEYFEEGKKLIPVLNEYENIIAEFGEIKREHADRIQETETKIEQNEQEYKLQEQEINEHLEKSKEEMQKFADKKLDRILILIDECISNKVDKAEFDVSIVQIKKYREQFKTAKNYAETKEILNNCNNDLAKIEQMIRPHMQEQLTPQKCQEFEINLVALRNMYISPENDDLPSYAFVVAELLRPSPPPYEELETQDQAQAQEQAQEQAQTQTQTNQQGGTTSTSSHGFFSPGQQRDPPSTKVNGLNPAQIAKIELQEHKAETAAQRMQEVSEENREDYKDSINNASDYLQIKAKSSTNVENKKLIENAVALLHGIKKVGFSQADSEVIKPLYNNLSKLSKDDECLAEIIEKLPEVFDYLEIPEQDFENSAKFKN